MSQQWQQLSDKYAGISKREQILIMITGIVVIVMMFYSLSIDNNFTNGTKLTQQTRALTASTKMLQPTVVELEQALKLDPNDALKQQIMRYESELGKIDGELLTLTSDLINPVQMRKALVSLLALERGVSLVSFELIGVEPVLQPNEQQVGSEQQTVSTKAEDQQTAPLSLYKHGIRVKLSGSYFQLRNYLQQLEAMSWKFFWQGFDYKVAEYPKSELVIEIYSLSTKQEFIGV